MKKLLVTTLIAILPVISYAGETSDCGMRDNRKCPPGCESLVEDMSRLKGNIINLQQQPQSIEGLDQIISNYQQLRSAQNNFIQFCE